MLENYQKSLDKTADQIVQRIDDIDDIIDEVNNKKRDYKKIIELKTVSGRPKSTNLIASQVL